MSHEGQEPSEMVNDVMESFSKAGIIKPETMREFRDHQQAQDHKDNEKKPNTES